MAAIPQSKVQNPKSKSTLDLLRRYESSNVTFLESDGSWPIVWERAQGVHVWDAEGRRYLDLTAAFGVAAAGHANRRVVRAGQAQMATLLHAMGDVHPHALKARLARELSRVTFERWSGSRAVQSPKSKVQSRRSRGDECRVSGEVDTCLVGQHPARDTQPATGSTQCSLTGKTIFCNSGFEAVEAALKTALLATGKPGVIAFEGAYHGLGYGALNATHREHFRSPFRPQLREFGHHAFFPAAGSGSRAALEDLDVQLQKFFRRIPIGALLVEPIQVRGGVNIPPPKFLPYLRRLCDDHGALLILDEIYTGFGRTGKWFACEHSRTVPDVVCLGKALTGGFPLSACVGRAELMDAAWPPSTGEAIHTSTFLGHPVGCAMALAQIRELETRKLVERSEKLGRSLLRALESINCQPSTLRCFPRGCGLLAGLELRSLDGTPATRRALDVLKQMLHRGFILLPEGEHPNVLSFTPPLTIAESQLQSAVAALQELLTAE